MDNLGIVEELIAARNLAKVWLAAAHIEHNIDETARILTLIHEIDLSIAHQMFGPEEKEGKAA